MSSRATLFVAAVGVLLTTGSAWAQPLGSFRWQQQPYCNILTLNVIGEGGNYTLDGTDDLCGASQRATVTGIAQQNPDGTIGFGLTIVGPPGGAVHLTASINLVTLGGTWSDSNGNTGLFAFTPGTGIAGSPRPATLGNPTRATHTYNLAAGATSPPISVPLNIAVSLTGTQLVSGFRGVGQVTLLSVPGTTGFIDWVGLHSHSGTAASGTITQGFSGTAGTAILFIDCNTASASKWQGAPGRARSRFATPAGPSGAA